MSRKIMEEAKKIKFGTELEYVKISREKAAKAIHSIVGGQVSYVGGSYDTWLVTDLSGRKWKCVSDASLTSRATSAEVVTPILTWDDFDTLQEVVRALRKAGAKVDKSCSQHVHANVQDFTPKQIANLARIHYKQEELILKAVGTWEHRLAHYTKRTDKSFIERLEKTKPTTNVELNKAWFGYENLHPAHYESHRYASLNLNSVWIQNSCEWRIFNGVNHAGHVKHHIILCLALAALAKNAKSASCKNQRPFTQESAKFDFRVMLNRLGFLGDEFKNARKYFLANLPGNSAWKNGRPESR